MVIVSNIANYSCITNNIKYSCKCSIDGDGVAVDVDDDDDDDNYRMPTMLMVKMAVEVTTMIHIP